MGIFSAQLGTTLIAVTAATRFASLEGHLLSVVVVWFGATLLFDLLRGAERVTEGEYTQRLPVTSNDEFGELVASFNRMQEGLLERELRRGVAYRDRHQPRPRHVHALDPFTQR